MVAVTVSIVVHAAFIVHGFGEPDAARLAVQSATWHQSGVPIPYYTIRSSPLYLYVGKVAMDAGLPMSAVPAAVNWAAVIVSALSLIPLYLVWRGWAGRRAAAVACVLFWFTPAFWLSSVYGMPHIHAFAMFLLALLLFASALRRRGGRFWLFVALSAAAAAVSVGLKADIVLAFGGFFSVAVCARRVGVKSLAAMAAICGASIGYVSLHARSIEQEARSVAQFAAVWSKQFPFTFDAFKDASNLSVMYNSVGWGLLVMIIAGAVYCAIVPSRRRLLLAVLLWALPALAFWGLKMGNSARHVMVSYGALLLPAGALLHAVGRRWVVLSLVVPAVLAANYFTVKPGASTVSPSARLFESTRRLQRKTNDLTHMGVSFAASPRPKKAYAGTYSAPIAQWEVLARAPRFEMLRWIPFECKVSLRGGKEQLVRVVRVKGRSPIIRSDGEWYFSTGEGNIRIPRRRRSGRRTHTTNPGTIDPQ